MRANSELRIKVSDQLKQDSSMSQLKVNEQVKDQRELIISSHIEASGEAPTNL